MHYSIFVYSWFNVCPALQRELHNYHSYRQKVSLLPDLPVISFFNSYILAVLSHYNPYACVSSFLFDPVTLIPRPEFTLLVDPPAGDPEYLIAEIKLPGVVRRTNTHTLSSLSFSFTLFINCLHCLYLSYHLFQIQVDLMDVTVPRVILLYHVISLG